MRTKRVWDSNPFRLLPPSQRIIALARAAGVEPLTRQAIDAWWHAYLRRKST